LSKNEKRFFKTLSKNLITALYLPLLTVSHKLWS